MYRLNKIIKSVVKLFIPNKIWIKFYTHDAHQACETNDFGIKLSKNTHECVVLANGPSLKKVFNDKKTYEFIKNKKKFCVNGFCFSEEFFKLSPDYICFMDPVYFSKNLSDKMKKLIQDTYDRLSLIDWEVKIFLPTYAKEWNFILDLPEKNKCIAIIYINISKSKYKKKHTETLRFLDYRVNNAVPGMQTVALCPIYLAINIGFPEIYLFGFDQSWHESITIREDNVLCMLDKHFYDTKEQKRLVPCYKDGSQTSTFTIAEEFYNYAKVFSAHFELNKYSEFMNVKIYNCGGSASYIDAYERKSFC